MASQTDLGVFIVGCSPGRDEGPGAAGHGVRRGILRLPTELHPAWIGMPQVVVV